MTTTPTELTDTQTQALLLKLTVLADDEIIPEHFPAVGTAYPPHPHQSRHHIYLTLRLHVD